MQSVTRRRFLRGLAVGGSAAAALASARGLLVPGRAHAARASNTLQVDWWGESEAIGIERWMNDTLARFQAETGIPVNAKLLTIEDMDDPIPKAMQTGMVPDVQVLWNGTFLMDNVWRGYVLPLNGVVAHNVLKRSGATSHSVFEGKQYRVGFYTLGFGFSYNKVLFDRAGLDADHPPTNWDAFLGACDRLKSHGLVPIVGGASDGFFGDWFLTSALPQQLDSPAEALQLFIGNRDWREPRYYEHWGRLEELHTNRFFNPDITTLKLYEGTQLFDSGQAALTLNTTASLPKSQAELGQNNVGFMVMPVFGQGKMAGQPIIDKQGFGIPTVAADPKNAARFLEFMHSKERLQAMWTLSHQIPADEAFDTSVVDDPLLKSVVERWVTGKHVLTIEDLMPVRFWTDAMFVASQKIVAGEMTGEQAGQLAHTVTEAWRAAADPETVNNYAIWGNNLEE
jgi:ABC-type glycerol-3-phosphate transport system substrate-binding protein